MSNLYAIVGVSGAGKDTVAEMLGGKNIKFAAPAKRFLEECYDIPVGSLDDREFRKQLVPGEEFTYLDALVRSVDAWRIIDPLLTGRGVIKYIQYELRHEQQVLVTDCRLPEEAKALAKLNPTVLFVYRDNAKALDSDKFLADNLNTFAMEGCRIVPIANNGTIEELAAQVEAI